jgi:hypothetical protein
MNKTMMSVAFGMMIVGAVGTMEASAAPKPGPVAGHTPVVVATPPVVVASHPVVVAPVRPVIAGRVVVQPRPCARIAPLGYRWRPFWMFRTPVFVIRGGC